jgi:chemotaxis protein MotC
MRPRAPILCLAVAALIAGSPAALGAGSEQKADAHANSAQAKKDKPARAESGKDAPAPPPPRIGCYYNPNAPSTPLAGEQAGHPAPDAHGGEGKAEHPAAASPPAAEQPAHTARDAHGREAKAEPPAATPPSAAEQSAQAAPDAHGEETKVERPAAASAEHDGAFHAPSGETEHATAPLAAAKSDPPLAEPVVKKNEAEQPYMLIRTLESVQDKIASGSRDAHIYQRELISEIAKKLPQVTDEEWKQPRNSRGAIIYALSGGDPGVLAKLLSLSPVPCIDDNLVKGLLDYSQGHNTEALTLLSKIDARTLDPRAGGHLALAQAMLVATEDPKRAIAYLDMARLLAPGTLVEEAALRRGAVVAAQAEDLDKFKLLTSQYMRRYHKSFYAGDFIRRVATAVTTGKYAASPALFQEFTETFDTLAKDQQKSVYSAIAEAGIVRGHVQLTLLAAKKLADQAKDDPKRALQARLYEAAVLLVTDDYERATAQLKSIDRAQLGPRDQPLLDAALTVASRIRAAPPDVPPGSPPPVSAEQGKDAELSQVPAVVGKANKAIGKVDELLDGGKR